MRWLGRSPDAAAQRAQHAAVVNNHLGRNMTPAEGYAELHKHDDFYATRPPSNRHCQHCNVGLWEAAMDDRGTPFWCCDACSRPLMTDEEWQAECAKKRAAEAERAKAAADASTPTALRAVLVSAVDRKRETEAELVRVRAGLAKVSDAVIPALRARDAAAAAVVKESDAEALVAQALGDAPAPSGAPVVTPADLRAAEEAYTRTRAARGLLETKVKEAERAVGFADDAVRRAAVATVRAQNAAALAGFLADAARLQDQIDTARGTLHRLLAIGLFDQHETATLRERLNAKPRDPAALPAGPLLGKAESAITHLIGNPTSSPKIV